jgi:hypothetical protein
VTDHYFSDNLFLAYYIPSFVYSIILSNFGFAFYKSFLSISSIADISSLYSLFSCIYIKNYDLVGSFVNFTVFNFLTLFWTLLTSNCILGGIYAPSSSGTINNLSLETLYVKKPSISIVWPPELSISHINLYLSSTIFIQYRFVGWFTWFIQLRLLNTLIMHSN